MEDQFYLLIRRQIYGVIDQVSVCGPYPTMDGAKNCADTYTYIPGRRYIVLRVRGDRDEVSKVMQAEVPAKFPLCWETLHERENS